MDCNPAYKRHVIMPQKIKYCQHGHLKWLFLHKMQLLKSKSCLPLMDDTPVAEGGIANGWTITLMMNLVLFS